LFRYLQNVSFEVEPGRPSLEFQADGTQRSVELMIVNLQPGVGAGREFIWEQVTCLAGG
jgi:hypothetical protein